MEKEHAQSVVGRAYAVLEDMFGLEHESQTLEDPIGQPEDVSVLWGYGLFVDKPGDFVKKPMSACTGREIMTEVLGHLGVREEVADILEHAICIPCMMPFITSQFLPRERGDRLR